ncbi:XRE family transcriptional regulator [bacterium 1XD42-8]|nr:XRE family transcriptional regulator [bacterium 1XD42-8]
MEIDRKDANIQIGKRLREARTNMNVSKAEIAKLLDVTEEHYRKLESGVTGLSADKLLILYHTYGMDPTYLITGVSSSVKEFNLDYYVANSSKEQRDQFFDRVLAYLSKLIK